MTRVPVPEEAPRAAADAVLRALIPVTLPSMLGVHDAHMAIVHGKAYIVYEANDVCEGESDRWPYVYCAMSIVDIQANAVEAVLPIARSGQVFENAALPPGQCFVPRVLALDDATLRVYFVSQDAGVREEEVWYTDFDVAERRFTGHIHRVRVKTPEGTLPLQPRHHFAHAAAQGYARPAIDYAMYLFDILLPPIDGRIYVVLNNFQAKLNTLAVFDDACETLTLLGSMIEPGGADLSEAGIQRLPDGGWLAILRRDDGDCNCLLSASTDGLRWSPAVSSPLIENGSNSKPTLHRFGDTYFMGWQEKPGRTRFNIETSRDGLAWARAFSFDLPDGTLQYPSLCAYGGDIYLCATGLSARDEIVFGRLCPVP